MNRYFKLLLSILALHSFALWGNAEIVDFDAVTSDYGQLESVIGDRLLEIDSLTVTGPINDADLATIKKSISDGRLSALNLEMADIEYDGIPFAAFRFAVGLRHVTLPRNLRAIDNNAFQGCVNLTSVEMSNKMSVIMASAFEDCKSLTSIHLNDGLQVIAEYAFLNCSLDSIIIPPTVKKIGDQSLSGNKLKKLYLMPKVAPKGVNYSVNCMDCDIDIFCGSTPPDVETYIPVGSKESYRMANGWDYLINCTETDCFPLEPVKAQPFEAVITAEGQLGELLSATGYAIDSLVVKGPVNEADIRAINGAVAEAYIKVVDMRDAKVKEGIIPQDAFVPYNNTNLSYREPNLRRIILPEDIVEIGDNAFNRCTAEIINLPKSVIKMGVDAFSGSNVMFDRLVIPVGVAEIPKGCFSECKGIKEIILPPTLQKIGVGAFSGTGIKKIELPSNITEISDALFKGSLLEEITLPQSVASIGEEAFYDSNLQRIVLHDGIKYVGKRAFYNNKLEEIIFPDTQIEFGEDVFYECDNLKQVTIPDWMTVIPGGMFSFCHELENVIFPDGLREISATAFWGSPLKEIVVQEGLETIGNLSFSLGNFESITLPASVKSIGRGAFNSAKPVKYIRSMAVEPPKSDRWNYPEIFASDIPVYVPVGSGDKYRAAEYWSYFKNFIEVYDFSTVGIDNVTSTEDVALPVEVYTVAGRRVYAGQLSDADLPAGIYIVKSPAGSYKITR
ncbi:MAG: leucine-rich repeat domain-containing protein [Muribaculum sp.]|nr:leucine-rich repeat domain-containing protein [Muribaculum sp.]